MKAAARKRESSLPPSMKQEREAVTEDLRQGSERGEKGSVVFESELWSEWKWSDGKCGEG